MFVNLLLDDQDAQFELPGLLLRVSTAKYVESQMDDPFANNDDLKQGIWSTVGGNLLGMLFCVMGTTVIIFLEKRYQEDMELKDAIHTALLTLREGFEGEMNGHNIEVGVVSKSDGKFLLLTPEQIQDYLDEAN